MTTKDEALRLALEALTSFYTIANRDKAITAIREALAQPAVERGELLKLVQAVRRTCIDNPDTQDALDDLEAALLSSDAQPSEWVGLTEDEANALWESTDSDWELMKRTEKFLREKNAGKPVGINGLTHEEESATASVMGIVGKPTAEDKAGGEPVAWMREGWGPDCGPYVEFYRDDEMGWRDRKEWTPLYTRPQPQAIPDGYVLVPVEPTHDQTEAAGCKPGMVRTEFVRIYKAMINAAQMKGESE